MNYATVELMRGQVQAIYRAMTGNDLPESEMGAGEAEAEVDEEEVARSFAVLEALVRGVPAVAQRVPPFYFSPPIDVLELDDELLVEIAVPGIERADVTVERAQDTLWIRGIRRGDVTANGRVYLCAEIPRGTFQRAVQIPPGFESEPNLEVERGTIRVHLARTAATRANESTPQVSSVMSE